MRPPATANTQASYSTRVDWTPVFTRGKICIFVVDPDTTDASQPRKFADAENLGKFIRDTGGVSPTMVYAYGFTLCRRAVVVTMDEATKNLDLLESHH